MGAASMVTDGGGSSASPSPSPTTPTNPVDITPYASTPYATPIPDPANYLGADAAANTAYANALANINASRQSLLRANGYLGDVDPTTGNISNLRIDPYNPYGNLQQMFDSQAHESMRASDAAVGAGLHGGLANQPEAELNYLHGVARTNFGQTMQAALQGLTSQQTDASSSRDNALWQAMMNAEEMAIQNQQFDPALYGTNDPGSGSDSGNAGDPTDVGAREAVQSKARIARHVLNHIKHSKKGAF